MADQSIPEAKTCTKCGSTKVLQKSRVVCRRCNIERRRAWIAQHSHPREYETWISAKARCYNPKYPSYHCYGGRGITMSDEWRASFDTFLSDMGPRPEGYSLNRVDNDGPYAKWNCAWSTRSEQGNNRRTNRHLTIGGETLTVLQWARRLAASDEEADAIASRVFRGWSLERAVSTPFTHQHRVYWRRGVTFGGETLTLTQWAQRVGMSTKALHHRLHRGWSLEKALTTPPRPSPPRAT